MTTFSLPQTAYLRHEDLAKFATQSSKDLIVDHVEGDGRVIVRNRKFAERLVAWVNQNLLKRTDPRAAALGSLFVRHLNGLGRLGERALGTLDLNRAQVGLRSRDVRLVFETLGAGGSARFRFDNVDWRERHREEAQTLAEQFLSGGAAFDAVMQASGLEWARPMIDMQAYDDRFVALFEGFLPELTQQDWELPLSEMVHALALRALLSLAPEKPQPRSEKPQPRIENPQPSQTLIEATPSSQELALGEGPSDLERATVAAQAHYQSITTAHDRALDETVLEAMLAGETLNDVGSEDRLGEALPSAIETPYEHLSARLDQLEVLRRTHLDATDDARTVQEHLMQSALADLYANLIAGYRDACCRAESMGIKANAPGTDTSIHDTEALAQPLDGSLSSNPRRKEVLDRIQHAIDAALQAKTTQPTDGESLRGTQANAEPASKGVSKGLDVAGTSKGSVIEGEPSNAPDGSLVAKTVSTASKAPTARAATLAGLSDADQKYEDLETIRALLASRHRYGGSASAWRHDCADALQQLYSMRRETVVALQHISDPKQMVDASRMLQSIDAMSALLGWESSISDRVFGGQYLAHLVLTESDEDLWDAIGTLIPATKDGDRYALAAAELRYMLPALPRSNPKDVEAVGELCANRRQEVYSAIQTLEHLSAVAPEQLDAVEVEHFIQGAEQWVSTLQQKGLDDASVDKRKLAQELDHYIDLAVHTLARADTDESEKANFPLQMLDRLSAARIELLWLESLSLESGLIEVDRMIHQGESLQSKDPSLQSRTGSRDAGGIGPEAFDQYAEHLHQMRHHFMASLQDHAADGQWEQVAASHALEGLFDRRLALLKRAQQT